MKALILAAGIGSRLRPITENRPKSMVEVNGVPIIFKQIDNLLKNNIHNITVVAGYKADMLISALNKSYPNIKVIINDNYEITNNMYSSYLAKEEMYNEDFLLMNADVFYDISIIEELVKDKYENSIVVEKGNYNDENMKVKCVDGRLIEISKQILKNDSYGVSIDVYRFSKEGSITFYEKIIDYIERKEEVNHWTEVALNDVLKEIHFKPCPIKGKWMEIDNFDDLKKAEIIFK
jgi:L-glutamine-phosphate cytidylyltransferase